jgi:hypothetical protein
MRTWIITLSSFFISSGLFAQEQMAMRINETGMLKIMEMALQYNTSSPSAERELLIPQNIYKFSVPQKQLLSNPIVSVVNEISDLDLRRDLDFYLSTSDIKVSGKVDPKSLKTTIFNSHDNGFDLRLSISLPKVEATGVQLNLCEDQHRSRKRCGSGLKATLSNVKIVTKERPVTITAVMRLRTDGNVARLKVISVDSNLEGRGSPTLDVNFSSIVVPRIAIVINGQETELDTSRLKNEIMKRKAFLGAKLLSFAAEFIASDMAEMVNVYLVNKQVSTSWRVYQKDTPVSFNEFLGEPDRYGHQVASYVRPKLVEQEKDPIKVIMNQIADVIHNAQVELSLKKMSTPGNKDLEFAGLLNFVLNNRSINVRNTLGNSRRSLPPLDLNSYRNHDINLAISEPLINGALDLVNSTGLFQELFDELAKVQGFSIRNVKLHFNTGNSVAVIVNSSIDLNKLSSSGVSQWVKNWIASFLERNNNGGVIYFPIQVDVFPGFKTLPDGSVGVSLYVKSPFMDDRLVNTFNYQTNVGRMHDIVRKGVMEELKKSLNQFTNTNYNVDVTKFLNQAGVVFKPKMITINQSAYLLLNLDISDIKFNSKNPNQR